MDGIATAFASASLGKAQVAVAARMLKINAGAEAGVAQLVEAAQDNVERLAPAAAGLGGNLDISV